MTDQPHRDLHPNVAEAAAGEADAAALDALARRLAALDPDEALVAPPADLFARIEAELAADEAPLAAPIPLGPRRRPRVLVLVGAGVAAAVALVVGILVLPEDEPERRTEVVALEPLPGFEQAGGSASLVISGDERTVGVDLDLTDVEVPAGSHLELWLLDPAVEQLVPLGVIDGPAGHQIPADVDLSVTPIVDVSVEQDDGDPGHSGVSVVRGQIT
jgi:anti-sigma-K factor RskA